MKNKFFIVIFTLFCSFSTIHIDSFAELPSLTTYINENTKHYENNVYGYSIDFYQGMNVNESIFDIRTRLENENTVIDIFYDDFNNSPDNYATYKNYGNKSLLDNSLFKVTSTKYMNVVGIKSHLIYYSRPKFSSIINDKNYYACIEIPRTYKSVYTIVMKSTNPITDFEPFIKTLKFTQQTAQLPSYYQTQTIKKKFGKETQEFYDSMFSTDSELKLGLFEPNAPRDMYFLKYLEFLFEHEFPVVVRYQHMGTDLPLEELINAKEKNKVVELTLQTTKKVEKEEDITYKILSGDYDQYFIKYANDIKSLNYPVLFRLNNEMNGDWCKYSAYHYGKDADLYIALYRHIYDIFKLESVDNAIFVWNPNEKSYPNFAWNNFMAYYPGDEYVDVVGLTGYNTGTYYKGENWRSFEQIYDDFYYEYANRFSQPLMITEFGSSSIGGDKPKWISEMFDKIQKYDRIKLAIWWSSIDKDSNGNSARIYKIDENEQVIEAVKNGILKLKLQNQIFN